MMSGGWEEVVQCSFCFFGNVMSLDAAVYLSSTHKLSE